MAQPDTLFSLIKALSKAEKRHFKLQTINYQTSQAKDYIRLFDAIDSQQKFDRAAIREKFKNEPYFRQLRNVKLYLHRQIMKSLKSFHDETTYRIKLNNYMTEIEIFCHKELFKDCFKTIKKARAHAEKYECLPELLNLIEWEEGIAFRNNDVKYLELMRPKWIADRKEILMKCAETHAMEELFMKLQPFVIRKGSPVSPVEKQFLHGVLSDPLLQTAKKTFQAEINRLTAISMCSMMLSDNYDERRTALVNEINYWESNAFQANKYINVYFGTLIESVDNSLQARKFREARFFAEKAGRVHLKKHDCLSLKNRLGFLSVSGKMQLWQGNFAEALGIIPEVNTLLETNYTEQDPADGLLLHYFIFYIYFINKDFKNAQFYIQKIINYAGEIRTDIQSIARLANLILQYEQKEYEHIGYILKSTYHYLSKKHRLTEAENIVLDFIKKALSFTSEKQILAGLKELKNTITARVKEPFTINSFFITFPLMEWIDSKLQNKSMAEIFRENYLMATKPGSSRFSAK